MTNRPSEQWYKVEVEINPSTGQYRVVSDLKFEDIPKDDDAPYYYNHNISVDEKYNPNYGDNRECECGHPYYRHFDSYEDMWAVGCKYCSCHMFKEKGTPSLKVIK